MGNRDVVANRVGYLENGLLLYEEMTSLDLLNFFGDARNFNLTPKMHGLKPWLANVPWHRS